MLLDTRKEIKKMKSILMSIQPKWVAKTMNGEKDIEVRKNKALASAIQKLIDKYSYADIYVYCTKSSLKVNGKYGYKKELVVNGNVVNGKVPFKFRCYKVEETYYDHDDIEQWYATHTLNDCELEKQSCLDFEQLDDYLKGFGYAIHISQLEIFDKPKELSEFRKPYTLSCDELNKIGLPIPLDTYNMAMKKGKYFITKAPQSWCYVEVVE